MTNDVGRRRLLPFRSLMWPTVTVAEAALSTGLLTRIRLDGGSESASPDQRGQRKGPEEQ